jgi:hypothetical protein
VGPAVPGGNVALTDSASGLIPGILYVSRGSIEDQTSNRPDDMSGLAESSVADVGSTLSAAASAETRIQTAQRSSQADAAALVQADRLAGIAAMLGRLLTLGAGAEEESPAQNGQTTPQELLTEATAGQPDPSIGASNDRRSDRIEHAEIGVPTTLLLASAAAYRLRQLTSRWWRRSNDRTDPHKRPRSSGLGPGPRCFRNKTGAKSGQATFQQV